MATTLTWVVNDVAGHPLRAEHGFAVWIEAPGGCALFDTGGSGPVLTHNLAALDLALPMVDAIALSHAHDDHTGGLIEALHALRPDTPIYAHPTLFRPRYSDSTGAMTSRGLSLTREALDAQADLRLSAEPQEIVPGVWTTGAIAPRPEPEGRSPHHFTREGDAYVPDPYSDDLSLVLAVEDGVFLLCGCCHAGLLNTLAQVQRTWDQPIVGIGGGTHMGGADAATIARTVAVLQNLPDLRYAWLGHCSGEDFVDALAAALPDDVVRRAVAGQSLNFTEEA